LFAVKRIKRPGTEGLREQVRVEGIVETEIQAKNPQKIRVVQPNTFFGGIWFTAWLFTIGYLHLGFWKGVLAIVLWPYYIGVHVNALMR
jgi:hypothetical protein